MRIIFVVALGMLSNFLQAQVPENIKLIFPKGTVFHSNIPYAADTLKKHLLDIYLPANAGKTTPLIVWIHGGAWRLNDKYADMSYMKQTVAAIINAGYGLASIDYRHSTTAAFPAQWKDCVQAIQFLHDNAGKYNYSNKGFTLFGFSAGGHLASLIGLSLNNKPQDTFGGKSPAFNINGVLDFYGPVDLLLFYSDALPGKDESDIARLLGASPLERPDLARQASPVSYIDKGDPPFLIVHGELDDAVPPTQSHLLQSWLRVAGAKNDLIIVKGAPHYGEMFDKEDVRSKVLAFIKDVTR